MNLVLSALIAMVVSLTMSLVIFLVVLSTGLKMLRMWEDDTLQDKGEDE